MSIERQSDRLLEQTLSGSPASKMAMPINGVHLKGVNGIAVSHVEKLIMPLSVLS